eukprot:jgi/Hompol1/2385/HPOL_001443-RA
MRKFHLIVATTTEGGIGKDGSMPWSLPGDMAYFLAVSTWFGRLQGIQPFGNGANGIPKRDATSRDRTPRNVVIMGRKTWESIPAKYRPLRDRINLVLTRSKDTNVQAAIEK